MVLEKIVVREGDEVLGIVCAAKSCENCHGLCVGGDVAFGCEVSLLDIHSCGGNPAEEGRNGALCGGVSHLTLYECRVGVEAFDDRVLEVSESGEENVALGESVVKVFDHTNFSCVGAGGVVAFGPEAVRSCPFAFLFSESVLAGFGNSFCKVLIERMGILHIHRMSCAVDELKYTIAAVPLEYAVVDIIGVEVNRTMDNIPNIVTRAGCETGSIDTGAVSAFPEEFGSGSNIGVQAAVEGCEADSKAGVDLGKLRNLTPAEGRVTGLADSAHFFADLVAKKEVTDERFAADGEFVRKAEPRTDSNASFANVLLEFFLLFGIDFEIVLNGHSL